MNITPFRRRSIIRSMSAATGSAALMSFNGVAEMPIPSFTKQDPGSKPNIVLMVADDIGLQLGAYGDEQARTPYLDQFAGENVLFRNAFVTSPTCSPSRASILTGIYAHQSGQVGLSHVGFEMNDMHDSIPARLKDAGYYTGLLGKIHVKPHEAFDFDFKFGGFDYDVDGRRTRHVGEPVPIIDARWNELEEEEIPVMQVPDEVSAHTARFLDEAGDRPFFLMVNFTDPHPPYRHQVAGVPEDPKRPRDVEQLDFVPPWEPFHPNAVAGYYNGCTRLDYLFERVMQELRGRDLDGNSIIIFMSDHGPNFGNRGKGTLYEAGLQTPMIASFPGLNGPAEVNELVSAIDLFPTALDAAGLRGGTDLPGQSLLRLFTGQWEARDAVFGEANYHVRETFMPIRSIREKRYKLIHHAFAPMYADMLDQWGLLGELDDDAHWHNRNYHAYAQRSEFELYDLENDPHELHNLADDPAYAETGERLYRRLQAWQTQSGDFLLEGRQLQEKKEEGAVLLKQVFDMENQ